MIVCDRRVLPGWTAALLMAAAAGCGSNPNGPAPPPPAANAPQISCAVDVTVSGVTGLSQAVTFPAPVVTDGAAPVVTTCTPASGSAFPLGNTSITCAATDAQARRVSCSFNVTLKGFALGVTRFTAVGDSFTEGENAFPDPPKFVDPPNSYPTKLQATLDAAFPGQGISVINRGIGGEFIETTVRDLSGNLAKDRPGAVLVLAGYNDLLNGGCRVLDGASHPLCAGAITAVAYGVRDCIRRSKEAPFNIPYVFVSTLTPPGPLVPPSNDRRIRNEAIVEVNARIRQVVAAEGAVLVDTYPRFVGHETEYVSIDGLHLRPAGNQAIADAFFAGITAKIPQTPLFSLSGSR